MNDIYVHSLNPILLPIYGNIAIRWYGLAYLIGFICAYFLIRWIVQRQEQNLSKELITDLVTYAAFGILIGGRLGYVLFYSPDLILKFRDEFPFWGVLAVNEGGMASHGGMIGLVIACWLFARKYKVSLLYIFDLAALSGPVGIFFGRIANFINGELVGREVTKPIPWAVKFPSDIEFWPAQAPEKLRSLTEVIAKLPQGNIEKWDQALNQMNYSWEAKSLVYQSLRAIVEACQKGELEVIQTLAPHLVARHPSQIYQALLEGFLLFIILFFMWAKDRKPGIIGASFLIFYSIGRIIGEQFRLPDAHIGYQWLGLTRGQWLSIAMLIIGIVLWWIWNSQMGGEIKGWYKGKSIRVQRNKR